MLALVVHGFQVEAEIGIGRTGRVFRVRNPDGSGSSAVKVSHPSPRHSPEDLAFKHEYHLHARLRHPHIVRAHEFGELDEFRRFYTMDLVDGVSLRDLYLAHGVDALGVVAFQVCQALEYTHAQGTLHGDVKPSNLLLRLDGESPHAFLADFGHSQPIALESSRLSGTLAYMAPEGMNGWRLDARSDLYSLGVTLFEAISGQLPYGVTTAKELYHALLEYPTPSILESEPKLDANWARLLDALLSRNRDDRPPSATAAAERFAALLGTKPAAHGNESVGFAVNPTLSHVGHRAHLEQLLGIARNPREPQRVVAVVGEDGVGKSRLIEEFARRVELDGWLVYRSDARDAQAAGFRLLRRVWQEGRFRDLTRNGNSKSSTGRRQAPRLLGHARQAELERLVDEFLAEDRSSKSDRVYLFDSLECADEDSLAFLETLADRLRDAKHALLCVAGRGMEAAPWFQKVSKARPHVIHVEPLEEIDVQELMLRHLGGSTGTAAPLSPVLDDEEVAILSSWARRHAGGVPRRIETALRILVDQGYLTRCGPEWKLDKDRLLEDPALLEADQGSGKQLARLPEEARLLLELASVAGAEFDATALAALPDFDSRAFSDFLDTSVRLGILLPGPAGDSHYRFCDPQTARTLYESIPSDRRRRLHRVLAEHWERQDRDGHRVAIAEHLEKAGDRARARDAFALAASTNRRAGAFREAGRSFRKAWDLHTAKERESIPQFAAEWLRTLHANSHYEEGTLAAEEILAAAKGAQPEGAVETITILRAACLAALGSRKQALSLLDQLLRGSKPIPDPQIEAWALTTFGRIAHPDDPDAAKKAFERAREIGVRTQSPYVVGHAELQLGILAWRADDPQRALDLETQAQAHLLEAEGYDLLPAVWATQAICFWQLLEVRKAARFHRRAAESFLRQHRRAEAARSYQNLTHVLTELGHWDEADETLAQAARLNRTNHGRKMSSFFDHHVARLAYYRGQLWKALDAAEGAIHSAREANEAVAAVGHRTLRGLIELAFADAEGLHETATQVLLEARQIKYPWGIAAGQYLLGEEARLNGDRRAAHEYLLEALETASKAKLAELEFPIQLARAELFAREDSATEAKRILALCREMQHRSESIFWDGLWHLSEGRVHQRLENHDRACSALSTAYEIFANLGAVKLQADALAGLANSRTNLGNRSAAISAWKHTQTLYRELRLTPPPSNVVDEREHESTLPTVDRVLQAAASVSREITMLQSVDQVLERILDVAITYLGTERGVIALLDPDTNELRVRLARNIDRESINDGLVISRSTLQLSGVEGDFVHSGDALADPRLNVHESIRTGRIRSLVALPIQIEKQILGAIYMDHRQLTDLFGPEERRFLRFIADMAAVGIRNAQRFEFAEDRARNLRGELTEEEFVFPNTVIGSAPRMREIVRTGVRAVRSGRIVLLTGESGVGKDHLAHILHRMSQRPGEFVDCPLPTLPQTLIHGLLFGAVKGIATDLETRPGYVESAQGGTLFLNEIADLPMTLQAMLLHFLETGEFRRVGGSNTLRLDANIICATNANLEARMEEGTFREDLYHRLAQCVIEIPPLRERTDDIPDLVDLFLRQAESRLKRDRTVLHPLALDLLLQCGWEGNVRELKNCILSALDQTNSSVIERRHLDSRSLRKLRNGEGGSDMRDALDAVEVRRIHDAMARSGGVITRAATHLGITEAALRRRIKRHRLGHLVLQRRQKRTRR